MTDPYRHHWLDGSAIDLPPGKAVCVGRNYAAHARELNNPVPASPLLFIKPPSSLAAMDAPLQIPHHRGAVHHELEIALLIGRRLDAQQTSDVLEAVVGIGLALDLTLRDIQSELKSQGHPWEIAKGFDGACPCSAFVPVERLGSPQALAFSLSVNGELRQTGNTADMLFPISSLLAFMARNFTLLPGDIVLTGTPAGVSALHPGDHLCATLSDKLLLETQVAP